jgi:hypothetical protein
MEVEHSARGNGTMTAGDRGSDTAGRAASYRMSLDRGYVRCELFNRTTIDETREFLEAGIAEVAKHRCPRVLICVRNSKAVFTLERYGFSRYLQTAFESQYRIALVGDSLELRIAHQYIATLARVRGLKLRAFPEEGAAISWLTSSDVG